MTQIHKLFALLPLTAALAACGGGGGGSATMPVKQFSSFSSMEPNTVYQAQGKSVSATYTADLSTNRITGTSPSKVANSSASFSVTPEGYFQSLSVSSPDSSVTFSGVGSSVNLADWLVGVNTDNGQTQGFYINPVTVGWDYQTLGVWLTGLNTGSGVVAAGSYGSITPNTAVPSTGSATYDGLAAGMYTSSSGVAYETLGSLTANANFSNRTIDVATTNSGKAMFGRPETAVAAPELNYQGRLSYQPGSNEFAGAISADNMSGSAYGNFYGPGAQEIGGIYELAGGDGQAAGGFGARR